MSEPAPPPPPPPRRYDDDEAEVDSEANYKPKTIKFWTIMLGMYLSVLIVALVSLDIQPR
jgi:hypothetical protein